MKRFEIGLKGFLKFMISKQYFLVSTFSTSNACLIFKRKNMFKNVELYETGFYAHHEKRTSISLL